MQFVPALRRSSEPTITPHCALIHADPGTSRSLGGALTGGDVPTLPIVVFADMGDPPPISTEIDFNSPCLTEAEKDTPVGF